MDFLGASHVENKMIDTNAPRIDNPANRFFLEDGSIKLPGCQKKAIKTPGLNSREVLQPL